MDMSDGFGEILETGKTTVKKTAKSSQQGVQNFAKTAIGQVAGGQGSNQNQGTDETASPSQQQMSNDDAKKFLQDLYGVNDKSTNQSPNQNNTNTLSQKPPAPTPKQTIKTALGIPESSALQETPPTTKQTIKNAMGISKAVINQKTPEEQARIEALRNRLHSQYYQDLTNRKKSAEEHVTEKLDREGHEEKLTKLETEKKNPPKLPVTVKRGTGETMVGVSG